MTVSEGTVQLPFVQLFTDGACSGNPGPGGWGCILRHPASGKESEFSGGELLTTNNRMELQAVIEGLNRLRARSRVEVVTDSSYVAKGSSEWLPGWKRNGWKTADKKPVKNTDLWQRLDTAVARHAVHWHWVKGHAGHPEVIGTLGQIPDKFHLVSSVDDVEKLHVENTVNLSYVTQTTLSVDECRDIVGALHKRFPNIKGPHQEDICYATTNRQEAVGVLAPQADVVILDLGLPKMHGLEVLKRLRARGNSMPVLILTAADSVEERVKGLDYGADDYMAKPFALSELEARVRALTRRGTGGGPTVVKHGPLQFDQVGRVVYIDEKMLELSARELGLLEVLLKRVGRLVSKDQLVDHLCEWGEEVSNNAIEVYVHRLRKKIEVGGIRIATIRGLGYCLEKFQAPMNKDPA